MFSPKEENVRKKFSQKMFKNMKHFPNMFQNIFCQKNSFLKNHFQSPLILIHGPPGLEIDQIDPRFSKILYPWTVQAGLLNFSGPRNRSVLVRKSLFTIMTDK